MAIITLKQLLHRPAPGAAISPEAPVEVRLYGPSGQPISAVNPLPVDAEVTGEVEVSGEVDVSDRAERELGKVQLSGQNEPLYDYDVAWGGTEAHIDLTVPFGMTSRRTAIVIRPGNRPDMLRFNRHLESRVTLLDGPTAQSLMTGLTSFSVMLDLKVGPNPDEINAAKAIIGRHQTQTSGSFFVSFPRNSKVLQFGVINTDSERQEALTDYSTEWDSGEVHRVIAVYDSGLPSENLKLYVDGVLRATNDLSGPVRSVGYALEMGAHSNGSTGRNHGSFGAKNVAVWGRGLSPGEVAQFSTAQDLVPGDFSDAIGFWPMDEGSGETVNDRSGNDRHGVIERAEWGTVPPLTVSLGYRRGSEYVPWYGGDGEYALHLKGLTSESEEQMMAFAPIQGWPRLDGGIIRLEPQGHPSVGSTTVEVWGVE